MKKINRIITSTLMLLLMFSSCTNESSDEMITELESKSFEAYIDESLKLKSITESVALEAKRIGLTEQTEIENYIINSVAEQTSEDIGYLNFYNRPKISAKEATSNLNIRDLGLSTRTVEYFTNLQILDSNQDFEGMMNLLQEYKSEYSSDSDLESLAGVFATIEVYQDSLAKGSGDTAKCKIDASSAPGAAISGAISGAIWGVKFGSFLGPAGTVAGAVGGAIVGSIVSSIVNVGVQGVRQCE